MDPMEKSHKEAHLFFLYSDCGPKGHTQALRSGGHPRAGSASSFPALHWGEARRAVPSGQRQHSPPASSAGKRPLSGGSLPLGALYHHTGHSASTPSPVWPTTSLPPGSTQSSLTGGCGPFPEQSCPPSAFWAKRVRFHPFSL